MCSSRSALPNSDTHSPSVSAVGVAHSEPVSAVGVAHSEPVRYEVCFLGSSEKNKSSPFYGRPLPHVTVIQPMKYKQKYCSAVLPMSLLTSEGARLSHVPSSCLEFRDNGESSAVIEVTLERDEELQVRHLGP